MQEVKDGDLAFISIEQWNTVRQWQSLRTPYIQTNIMALFSYMSFDISTRQWEWKKSTERKAGEGYSNIKDAPVIHFTWLSRNNNVAQLHFALLVRG